jgi:vacuolar-type H+-ATPase subunit I/STV1
MKKNSLVFSALLFVGVVSLSSCKNDASSSKTFAGKYTVKVTEVNLKDLMKASEEVKTELEKGKKELHDNLEKAQEELDKEVNVEIDGKKVDLKEVMGEVGQGLEKVMDGFGDMGSGLGKGISELLIKNMNFQVEFRDNGELYIGSDNKNINFSAKKLTWEVNNGKLIVKNKDKNDETFSFDLTTKSDTEWELVSDKMTLLLSKEK